MTSCSRDRAIRSDSVSRFISYLHRHPLRRQLVDAKTQRPPPLSLPGTTPLSPGRSASYRRRRGDLDATVGRLAEMPSSAAAAAAEG